MDLPAKNVVVPTEDLINICEHYGMDEQAEMLRTDPPSKPFASDGASGCPEFLSAMVYEAAFLHDICYYLGGTEDQRKSADREFRNNLMFLHSLPISVAKFMYKAVRIGGQEELRFSWHWGFGRG